MKKSTRPYSDTDALLAACDALHLAPEEKEQVAAFLGRLTAERFERLAQALREDPAAVVKELRESSFESELGRADAWAFYFALALTQVTPALERRKAIGSEMNERMFADLPMRLRLNRQQTGLFGINIETLEWFQEYLSGDLVRIGVAQFKLIPFPKPIEIFEDDNEPSPGVAALSRKRERVGVRAIAGRMSDSLRAIDLVSGEVLDALLDSPTGRAVLHPGLPVIKLHIPHDAVLEPGSMKKSLQAAWQYFEARQPAGIYGESWFLDPSLAPVIRNSELQFFFGLGPLFPSSITELNTLKRLFHYDITRETLPALDPTKLSSLQRYIVQRLRDPAASLEAKSLFATIAWLKQSGCL